MGFLLLFLFLSPFSFLSTVHILILLSYRGGCISLSFCVVRAHTLPCHAGERYFRSNFVLPGCGSSVGTAWRDLHGCELRYAHMCCRRHCQLSVLSNTIRIAIYFKKASLNSNYLIFTALTTCFTCRKSTVFLLLIKYFTNKLTLTFNHWVYAIKRL